MLSGNYGVNYDGGADAPKADATLSNSQVALLLELLVVSLPSMALNQDASEAIAVEGADEVDFQGGRNEEDDFYVGFDVAQVGFWVVSFALPNIY